MDDLIPLLISVGFIVIGFVVDKFKPKAPSANVQRQANKSMPHRPQHLARPDATPEKTQKAETSSPFLSYDSVSAHSSNRMLSFDGEKIEPITFDNQPSVGIKETQPKIALPVKDDDPYSIAHHDFNNNYDWKKAIIASEILKTKF